MKNKWKKLLCALALIPCAAFMTACGETPPNDTTPPTEQGTGGTGTTEGNSGGTTGGSTTPTPGGTASVTEDQMYSKVHTLSSNMSNKETETISMKSDSYEIFTSEKIKKSTDNGLTYTEDVNSFMQNFVANYMLEDMLGGERYQQNVGYNLETGEGYYEAYLKEVPSYVSGEFLNKDAVVTAIGEI